MNVVTTVFDRK